MAKFLFGRPSFRQRIPRQVCDNLSLQNNLLPKFNGILFFNNKRGETYQLSKDKLLVSFGGFCNKHSSAFRTEVTIGQNTAFVTMTENRKDDYLPHGSRKSMIFTLLQDPDVQLQLPVNINIFEVQAILLRFQLQAEK